MAHQTDEAESRTTLQRLLVGSVVVATAVGAHDAVGRSLGRSYHNSWLWSAASAGKRTWQHSRIGTWLRNEPDTRSIVVDLRETWTIGPILRGYERVLATSVGRWLAATTRQYTGDRPIRRGLAAALAVVALSGLVLAWTATAVLWTVFWFVVLAIAILGSLDVPEGTLEDSRSRTVVRVVFEPPGITGESGDRPSE